MIKFLAAPDDVVAVKIDRTVDADELKAVTDRIDERLETYDSIAMYVDLRGLERLTLAALLDDLRYSLRHIADLSRIRRVALVTGTRWINWVASWENRLLPGLDIRVFSPEERTEGLDWVSEAVEPPTPGLRRIQTTHDSVRAFVLDGPIHAADVQMLADDLEAAYARHGTVRLLLRVEHYGLRPSVFTQNLVKMKLRALRHVGSYALVGGPDWMAGIVSLFDPLLDMDVRHYDSQNEAEAWSWLGAKPAAEAVQV